MPYIVLLFLSAQFTHASTPPIIINEIGAHEPAEHEWIEIYNQSPEQLDLSNWKFWEDQTKHGLKAGQGDLIIEPQEYAIIANQPAKFLEHHPDFKGTIIDSNWSSLKETGELIGLVDSQGIILEEFTYREVKNTSLQRQISNAENIITWFAHPSADTAGAANEWPESAAQSSQEIAQDPSDIPEESSENPQESGHQENVLGAEEKTPETEDIKGSKEEHFTQASSSNASSLEIQKEKAAPKKKSKQIQKSDQPPLTISEIFPNPYGSDAIYEFIELQNVSEQAVPLKGWSISNRITSFIFPDITLSSKKYLAITRAESHIPLDNLKDSLILKNPEGKIIDQYKYSGFIEENHSLQRWGKEWKISQIATRGAENIFLAANTSPEIVARCLIDNQATKQLICDASDSYDADHQELIFIWTLRDKKGEPEIQWQGDYFEEPYETFQGKTLELSLSDGRKVIQKNIKIPRKGEIALELQAIRTEIKKEAKQPAAKKNLKKKSSGSKPTSSFLTTRQGVVILPPDEKGKTMFIQFPGLKISSPRGRLPQLQLGDEVRVKGKLSKDGLTMTIAQANDVTFIQHLPPPEGRVLGANEDPVNFLHALVQIDGLAEEIFDTGFQIQSSSLSLPVYIPPTLKISSDRFRDQDVRVSGIIKLYRGEAEIVPRFAEDIVIQEEPKEDSGHEAMSGLSSIWHDWRVGTTLAVCSLIGLMGWRVRRLVPAPVHVDATVAGTNNQSFVKKSNGRSANLQANSHNY